MGNTVSVATCYGRIKHQHQTSSAASSTSPWVKFLRKTHFRFLVFYLDP
jgi:hypothetical protein